MGGGRDSEGEGKSGFFFFLAGNTNDGVMAVSRDRRRKGKVELANVFDAGRGRSCRVQCASTFLGTIDLDQTHEVGERAEQVLGCFASVSWPGQPLRHKHLERPGF